MSSDRQLMGSVLGLAALAHVGALAAPWVGGWTPGLELFERSGFEVVSAALAGGPCWSWLAAAHLLSVVTLLLAWRVPRGAWARRLMVATFVVPTLLVGIPLGAAGLWNGADAWPEGLLRSVIHALSPGTWWVEAGLLAWVFAQLLYVVVLAMRVRGGVQAQLQTRWADRSGAAEVGMALDEHRLAAVHAALRPLVLDAHQLRVDLDAPVRPVDASCRTRLVDLAIRLHQLAPAEHELLRREGIEPSRLGTTLLSSPRPRRHWMAELHLIDDSLRRFIEATTRPRTVAYR